MDKLAKLFKAVSDKNRLLIVLAVYQHGELCSCDFSDFFGNNTTFDFKAFKDFTRE